MIAPALVAPATALATAQPAVSTNATSGPGNSPQPDRKPTPDDKAAKDDDFNHPYDASVERVYQAAVQSASSKWHLQFADKDSHSLSFSTGQNMRTTVGFEMSATWKPH